METIFEIIRIEQIIREADEGVNYIIRSSEDGAKIASVLLDVMTVKCFLSCV